MTTATRQKWEGRWEQLKGRIKSLWGNVTDDELTQANGDYERTIGLLKERTGKSREELERLLDEGTPS